MAKKVKTRHLFNPGDKEMIKIISIAGTRPQFVKAAVVSHAIVYRNQIRGKRGRFRHGIIHTGQHYDNNMSEVFFRQLDMPQPLCNLNTGSASHGSQTGKMLIGIERALMKEKPDMVLNYGDTNSALAGALAAAKLSIPSGHIEAGLRSYNRRMPEEINRVLIDHIADLSFCPTHNAVENLKKEGVNKGVYNTGDVMYEAVRSFVKAAGKRSRILLELGLSPRKYYLATVHRQSNTDNRKNLKQILDALYRLDLPVVFPVHPRTRKHIRGMIHQGCGSKVMVIDPVSYFDMLLLEKNAKTILTDSGGVQKEAYFLSVPCVTLREETEWIETAEEGWNIIAGTDTNRIVSAALSLIRPTRQRKVFGDGDAGARIVRIIESYFSGRR